jgi:tetratricopeptide (TPR) repeat protein
VVDRWWLIVDCWLSTIDRQQFPQLPNSPINSERIKDMTQTEDLFKSGLERYQAGEDPDTLIPLFKDLCDRTPKNSNALTSLAWLYLLVDKPKAAYKVAQKAVKLNPQDAQARINLALAMLDSGVKGVRPHIEQAEQLTIASSELRDEVKENIADGFSKKPEWKSLTQVKKWLFE